MIPETRSGHGGGSSAASTRISSTRLWLSRSARGKTFSFLRSRGAGEFDMGSPGFALFVKNHFEQCSAVAKVRDDDIGAHPDQAAAFPLVHPSGAVVGFVTGDRHGQPARFFRILNFNVAVPEGQQLPAGNSVFAKNAF